MDTLYESVVSVVLLVVTLVMLFSVMLRTADGTGFYGMVGRGFDAKYVCSDEFKLNLNIACHSGTRLYCRSYHMNKKIIKKSSQDEIISYHIT